MLDIAPVDLSTVLEESHVEPPQPPHVQLLGAEPDHLLERHEAPQGEVEVISRGGPHAHQLFEPLLVEKLESHHQTGALRHALYDHMLDLLLALVQ